MSLKEPANLRYCLLSSNGSLHPQLMMKELGIKYQHAVPQSMGDCWWFFNCETLPKELPEYLKELKVNPMDCIGYGLSKEDAINISNYQPK